MVLIHIKRSDQEQFLFETTLEGEELSKYGPAKPLDKQGIDEYAEVPVDKGKHYCMDPTGRRTGNACDPEVAKVLLRTLDEASATASKVQAEKKIPLTRALLMEAVDNVRGAVMICYPMGLPEWDLVRMLLEDREEDVGASYGHERLDADSATLWFAAKQMAPDKPLSEYLGRHEKTKAVLKLQKKGAGAPGREPPVDQETQKAMMAWYYKKQEEQKKLAEDDDDTYTSAAWASNKSLKTKFAGISAVRLP
ncbi:uncharacterized protein HaLaN_11391, partial [Haematococcus lacustris]